MASDTLFVRQNAATFSWLHYDASGRLLDDAEGTTDEFADRFSDYSGQAILIVPGESVLLTAADVPSRQYRQIVQAVPFVVEERLATDVEKCFFALGERVEDNTIAVAVVDREELEDWLETVSHLPITFTWFIPETSFAMRSENTLVLVDGERAHIGFSRAEGLTIRCQDLAMTLAMGNETTPIEIVVRQSDKSSLDIAINELEASGLELAVTEVEQSALQSMVNRFDGSEINLLQAEYKVEQKRSNAELVWRSVAILGVCAVLLHLLTVFGQGYYLANLAEDYETQTAELYSDVFPNDRNVRDIRRRWNNHLGRTEDSSNEFLALFAQSSKDLSGAGLTLNNVNFNESRGDLILQVIANRSEELVQFSQRLSSLGLNAEIGTISQEGNSVRGSVKIKGQGG